MTLMSVIPSIASLQEHPSKNFPMTGPVPSA